MTMPPERLGLVSSLTDAFAALQEDIVNAMALTGQILMGQAVMVKSSEVRKSSCASVCPPISMRAQTAL